MSRNPENNTILNAFLELCQKPQFQKQWINADVWVEVIKSHSRISPSILEGLDCNKLKQLLGRSHVGISDALTVPNSNGIFVFNKRFKHNHIPRDGNTYNI